MNIQQKMLVMEEVVEGARYKANCLECSTDNPSQRSKFERELTCTVKDIGLTLEEVAAAVYYLRLDWDKSALEISGCQDADVFLVIIERLLRAKEHI